ncbi:SGNH/GDSL hydrolase family protein [Halovulum sp. GXIMD14794]
MTYSTIAYFGDSLTDNGNLSSLVSVPPVTLPPPPYHAGMLSDGPVHAELLLRLTGLGGLNLAIAGARAIGDGTVAELLDTFGVELPDFLADYNINLGAQVDRFLDGAGDLSDTAAAILIGANDLADFRPSSNPILAFFEIRSFVDDMADAVGDAASDLARAGIDTILHYTLPEVSLFPVSQQVSADIRDLGNDVVDRINDAVLDEFASRGALRDTPVEIIDLNRLASEVLDDPTAFGFLADPAGFMVVIDPDNPLDIGLDLQGLDADQFLFFDDLHPSAAFHGLIAIFTEATLELDTQRFLGGGNDTKAYGASRDFVLAGHGADTIDTNGGRDLVFGGLGGDNLRGGTKGDILSGGSGADTILGEGGADIIAGGRSADVLRGGAGNDLLIGGRGDDMVFGGGGNDLMFYTDPALLGGKGGEDLYDGKAGTDTVYVVLSEDTYDGVANAVDTEAALQQKLGLTLRNIENIELFETRSALSDIARSAGFEDADYWGFV